MKVITTHEMSAWRLAWNQEESALIGDDLKWLTISTPPVDREAWESWAATRAAAETKPRRDHFGYCWDTQKEAAAVARVVNAALKVERPLPEWAKQALAAGWPMPKGWKP